MPRILDDLRSALRSLLKSPGFMFAAVAILALGIGANTAIFSLVDRVVLKPLSYPDPGRLVVIWGADTTQGSVANPISAPDFLDWQRESRQLASMAALDNDRANLTGGREPVLVPAARVSAGFFGVLGVHPALGRDFLEEEDREGGPRAVILSHEFWTREYGGDPGLLGRSIRLDGLDTRVVGILPPGFQCRHYVAGANIFRPMAFTRQELEVRGLRFMAAIGRLRPGATAASCTKDLQAIAAGIAKVNPGTNRTFTARVVPMGEEVSRDARKALLMLGGAAAFVLLIACANLMNLMLARGARRQRDMAIRAALGATPAVLVRCALAESLVLGTLGGVMGLFLARWTHDGLAGLLGLGAEGGGPMALDAKVLAFTCALSLGAALLFGLLPALQFRRAPLCENLGEGKGFATSSHPRLRGLLVASETALATALLIAAGLMLRTFQHLRAVDPGFRPDHVLVARISLPGTRYRGTLERAFFLQELQRRLQATPGILSAAANDTAPMAGSTSTSSYNIEHQESGDGQIAINHHVTSGYFRTMGIPILQGRDLEPGETGAAVISETMARKHFPHSDPLQGRISLGRREGGTFVPVVGVAGNVHHEGLAQEPFPEMYFPLNNTKSAGFELQHCAVLLRTVPAPGTMIPVLKGVLKDMDPDLPLGITESMDGILHRDREDAGAQSFLLGALAAIAVLLAGVGIYAVVSFLTALRTREIGVRVALGAQVWDVTALVVGQGLRMSLAGVAAGAALALAFGRLLDARMVGVRPWDPATFLAVVAFLSLIGAVACLLPALRAARVDPAVALRSE